MGDWRTLHFFDKEKYKKEIVPLITKTESYLPSFFNDRRLRRLDGYSRTHENILKDVAYFISELSSELNIHPDLLEIQERKRDETYENYISRRNKEFENFIQSKQHSIEVFEFILIETIFSTVADFNPHFILGKRLFESCILTNDKSIAEALISDLISTKNGSILDLIDGGIIGWISKEEVELLFLDRDNILSSDLENIEYVNEFKGFLKLAKENNYGLISLRNPREDDLNKLQLIPNRNEVFVTDSNFKHIIIKNKSS